MPHSYAIAMFRMQDYRNAGIPVLPVVAGLEKARKHMQAYVVAFSAIALALFAVGACGYEYLVIASAVCFMWLRVTFRHMDEHNYVA